MKLEDRQASSVAKLRDSGAFRDVADVDNMMMFEASVEETGLGLLTMIVPNVLLGSHSETCSRATQLICRTFCTDLSTKEEPK